MMNDLFGGGEGEAALGPTRPLADRLRPTTLNDVLGQDHLLGEEGPLRRMAEAGRLPSLILWGPPGVGKTTIARLLAEAGGLSFHSLSAVFSGVADLKKAFETAKIRRSSGARTLLFVDEIHRFNRSQQDAFLPYVERGDVTLVGATTENPSFELNGALLSRCQVFVLKRLGQDVLEDLLRRAEALEGRTLPTTPEARGLLGAMADGDGRYLLSLAETLFALAPTTPLDSDGVVSAVQQRAPAYDKDREEHYNLVSALHKAVRGSDPDAALYWFARMIDGGEDPRFIARRLIRAASEDIGAADPTALPLVLAAWQTFERLGSPEGELALAQAVVHLAAAPKSNAVYKAYGAARAVARATGSLPPPETIRNAPTGLMKSLGYGRDYVYDHDADDGFSGQNYFPDGMERKALYVPKAAGAESAIKTHLDALSKLRRDRTLKD
jgi:putative ATPase